MTRENIDSREGWDEIEEMTYAHMKTENEKSHIQNTRLRQKLYDSGRAFELWGKPE